MKRKSSRVRMWSEFFLGTTLIALIGLASVTVLHPGVVQGGARLVWTTVLSSVALTSAVGLATGGIMALQIRLTSAK